MTPLHARLLVAAADAGKPVTAEWLSHATDTPMELVCSVGLELSHKKFFSHRAVFHYDNGAEKRLYFYRCKLKGREAAGRIKAGLYGELKPKKEIEP